MMQSNATTSEMQYKITKTTSNDHNVHFKVMANVFFLIIISKGKLFISAVNRNSYFIEKPMVLFSMTFSDFVRVISRSSYISTGNNVAASRGLLAIAKFLLEL